MKRALLSELKSKHFLLSYGSSLFVLAPPTAASQGPFAETALVNTYPHENL